MYNTQGQGHILYQAHLDNNKWTNNSVGNSLLIPEENSLGMDVLLRHKEGQNTRNTADNQKAETTGWTVMEDDMGRWRY